MHHSRLSLSVFGHFCVFCCAYAYILGNLKLAGQKNFSPADASSSSSSRQIYPARFMCSRPRVSGSHRKGLHRSKDRDKSTSVTRKTSLCIFKQFIMYLQKFKIFIFLDQEQDAYPTAVPLPSNTPLSLLSLSPSSPLAQPSGGSLCAYPVLGVARL